MCSSFLKRSKSGDVIPLTVSGGSLPFDYERPSIVVGALYVCVGCVFVCNDDDGDDDDDDDDLFVLAPLNYCRYV